MTSDERVLVLETQVAELRRSSDQMLAIVVQLVDRQYAAMTPAQRSLANDAASRDPAVLALIKQHQTKH